MGECTLRENVGGSGCSKCTSDLAALQRVRRQVIKLADDVGGGTMSREDAVDFVLQLAETLRGDA
jgi:hypothetical protein